MALKPALISIPKTTRIGYKQGFIRGFIPILVVCKVEFDLKTSKVSSEARNLMVLKSAPIAIQKTTRIEYKQGFFLGYTQSL